MDAEQRKQFIIYLSQLKGIGWNTLHAIVSNELYTKPQWDVQMLAEAGIRKQQSNILLREHNQFQYERQLEEQLRAQKDYKCITVWDEEYPAILRETAQPPWVLYAKGNLQLLKKEAIAIVGTRAPTQYGIHCTRRFSSEYSERGLVIVSGFANGVDTIAHQEALAHNGDTIAVLPSPINRCYPANNYALYEKISRDGLLLSETPPGTPIHAGQFHQRNRIIAGLSRASIIIEGKLKSGSMITARHTMEMDRELFAVPGPITSPKSEGPNFLIQKGYARMLMSADQLFDELTWLQAATNSHIVSEEKDVVHSPYNETTLTEEERLILKLLKENALTISELYDATTIPFGHLNVLLLNLSIKQLIELQSGSLYIAL